MRVRINLLALQLFCGYGRPMSENSEEPIKDTRSNILRIRLKKAERKQIDVAAERDGLESSTWARMLLLKAARRPSK